MEYFLRKTNCFLMQRGKFNIKKSEPKNHLSDVVNLDYMGRAEFEFGATSESLKRILINNDFYEFLCLDDMVDKNGKKLIIYAPIIFLDHIKSIVCNLKNNKVRTIEWNGFEYNFNENVKCSVNFWWDLTNDFFLFFDDSKIDDLQEVIANLKVIYKDNLREYNSKNLEKYYLNNFPELTDEIKYYLKSNKFRVRK